MLYNCFSRAYTGLKGGEMDLRHVNKITIPSKNKREKPQEINFQRLNKYEKSALASFLVDKIVDSVPFEFEVDGKKVVMFSDAKGNVHLKEKS